MAHDRVSPRRPQWICGGRQMRSKIASSFSRISFSDRLLTFSTESPQEQTSNDPGRKCAKGQLRTLLLRNGGPATLAEQSRRNPAEVTSPCESRPVGPKLAVPLFRKLRSLRTWHLCNRQPFLD